MEAKTEVNQNDLSWILHTSVEDAQHRIKTANLATLQEALKQEQQSKLPRKTLINAIERRIRVLSKHANQEATLLTISIKDPWAWAIFNAGKDYENRTWRVGYRGTLAIHVSKALDKEGLLFLNKLGIYPPAGLPIGCIIGEVDIMDCIDVSTQGKPDSKWAFGPFCWKLANARLYKRPIKCSGSQGLFRVVVTESQRVFVKSKVKQDG